MADFNITDPEIIKMLDGLTEEERQGVADQLQESLESGEVKRSIKDTKGIHPEPSETSLIQGLKRKRVDIKKILANPELRKKMIEGACNFLKEIGRHT